ncbi:WYL domain-containing protein [Ruminococcus sp. NK3A76]|uniref:helix-turn-helix transcriptional regulator n=1 Tax=Ruminococcus sp. NK3A76 TaxID=877411 RepID=UPI00048FDDD4|nr:WYL domain-containing protein [Ruminococcus sp. NK3A76]
MAVSGCRQLHILKYLYKMTDEEHYLTVHQIVEYLDSIGFHTHRQTICSDIDELNKCGFEVVCVKSSQNRYHIKNRVFSMSELTLLIDAVSAARTITVEQSNELIKKLSGLESKYNADKLLKNVGKNCIKSENHDIMDIIEVINRGIDSHKQISYKYYDNDENLLPDYRYDGKSVKISPYDLVWLDDRYYLIGFSVKHKKVITIRVDRMSDVKITKDTCVPSPSDYDVNYYIKHVFKMFDGIMQSVELKCFSKDVYNAVIDRFGSDIYVQSDESDNYIVITVKASVSKTFYSWVFQFDDDIEILSPKTVRLEYKKICQGILKQYK